MQVEDDETAEAGEVQAPGQQHLVDGKVGLACRRMQLTELPPYWRCLHDVTLGTGTDRLCHTRRPLK